MVIVVTDIMSLLYNPKVLVPLLLVSWYFIKSYFSYRRLSHIPGPWLAGWSSLWLVGTVWRKRSHVEFYDLDKKYGSLVRIAPNTLLTSSPDLVRSMNAARSPYKRSDWYKALRFLPGIDNVASMTDDKAHTRRRAQMNNGYLGKENVTLEDTINLNVLNFLRLIRTRYLSSSSDFRPMDLAQKAQFFTLDSIMDLATGAAIGDLEQDADIYSYLKTTADALGPMIMVMSVPEVSNLLQTPWIAKRLFPTAADEIGFGKLIKIAQKMVAERFAGDPETINQKHDMLQSFIRHGLTQQEAVSESLIQVLGGSDSTAGAIRMLMLHTMTSPHVYHAVQSELDSAMSAGRLSRPVVRDAEARALPYLQAVIREGLRVFPPGTGLLSKLVPPGGDTIDGVRVPAGTKIGTNIWALLRRKEVFGEDADAFRPERWLEAGAEDLARMERVQDLVWGYGKYLCLGRNVALIELNKVLVELFLNFDWTLINPTHPFESACYGIFVISDMWVRVTERTTKV